MVRAVNIKSCRIRESRGENLASSAQQCASFVGGSIAGIASMYFFDPNSGRRRRALARDKFIHGIRKLSDTLGVIARSTADRVYGAYAEIRGHLSDSNASDEVLVQRVRSKIGRAVSHPRAINVSAEHGVVTLSGPVLKGEIEQLLSTARWIRGVKGLDNKLEVHTTAGDNPSLQGGQSASGVLPEIHQRSWSPAFRLFAGVAGAGLASAALARRNLASVVPAVAGAALALRALTNQELKRVTGMGAGRRAEDFQKTITVAAPLEVVFRFWSRFENFPKFMSHIQEVRDLGEGRSHWQAVGPAGMTAHWTSMLTRFEPNRLLAWRSESGSALQHSGMVRFEQVSRQETRVHIKFSYNPPGGTLGQTLLSILGSNPKRILDQDLLRLKTLLEERRAGSDWDTSASHPPPAP